MAAGRTDIGNLSFFFFHSVIAMRQISASLCLKQMKTCFDPVKAEQAKYIRKGYVTPAPFKKKKVNVNKHCDAEVRRWAYSGLCLACLRESNIP